MKKILVVILTLLFSVALIGLANPVDAADDNIVSGGDFEGFIADGETELAFGDPAFSSGVQKGWGSGSWDSHCIAVKDPLNSENTVLKFSNTVAGKAWCSFFKFCTIEAGATYEISFDYMVEGSTDNFGMRFAGSPTLEYTFYSGNATGWRHTTWLWETDVDGSYDSIAIWFNTAGNAANVGYVDNIVVRKVNPSSVIVTGGNFEGFIPAGETELAFGDPAFSSGIQAGWGSGSWDSHCIVVKDPLNAANSVLKFSNSDAGKNWCSFFKFCKIEAGATYEISLDYLVEGTTDNFGMRFAGSPVLEKVFYGGAATNGWQHATWTWETDVDGSYDSIAIWFNTAGNAANVGYVDNIVVKKVVEESETPETPVTPSAIVTGGDFEGFIPAGETELAFGDPAFSTGVQAGWGSGSWDSHCIAVKDPLNAENTVLKFSYSDAGKAWCSFFKFCTIEAGAKYEISLDYLVEGTTDNFGMRFAGSPVLEKTFYDGGSTDGWQHATWTWETDADGSYDSIAIWFNTAGNAANVGYVDNIVVTKVVEEVETPQPQPTPQPDPESPFDPNKTYYQSSSMTVNGDMEAFAVGTVFSEDQLEGAWGSVSLDNPATIVEENGNKAFKLGKGEKTYSSAFLMLPDTLEVGQLLRLSYDIKLNLTGSGYITVSQCLVGGSNTEYYNIQLKAYTLGSGEVLLTSGAEAIHYPVKVTDLGNGWFNLTVDFQLTRKDLIQTNSVRWLLTAQNEADYMLIDNVNLYELSETPFETKVEVSSVEFVDGDSVSLKVGEEKTLGYTINPENATDTTVTFTTSNANVATVDANGKVVAVGKGACTITITAANGVKDEIAVLVSEAAAEPTPEPTPEPSKKGCGGSVIASVFGVLALAGTVVVLRKRKEQ